ncbi:ribonuclease P/MRP protein subunit POP5 [Eupeodes corollae]|uniref:ribonuclease P/MRP protein subunit POP5 n=1 Tax=Eupeodes corollae TaxID=290404 RepID=UPI002492216A|nr:ribonuclease P/MRP protein subunit POP5 [Eupeodes corollae]
MVRVKSRYIVVQIIPHESCTGNVSFNDNVLTKSFLKYIKQYYGDFGVGSLEHGFRIKYCNDKTKIAIIRCRHKPHRFVASILPLITVIGDYRAKFRTLYTGATIMQCNKFIVRHQREFLDRMVGRIASAKERNDLIKSVLEFELA